MKALLLLSLSLGPLAPWGGLEVLERPELPAAVREARLAIPVGRPALRGFRAPILAAGAGSVATAPSPQTLADPRLRAALEIVDARLARDGLLATAAAALEALGPDAGTGPALVERLAHVGLPVDLLSAFEAPAPDPALPAVDWIASALAAGRGAAELAPELARWRLRWTPSRAGFRVATESGEHAVLALRLQLSNPAYYAGEGDGSALDMTKQLAALWPEADLYMSLERKHLEALLASAGDWSTARPGRVVVSPEILPVSQWAQDNGKPGFAPGPDGALEVVTLVPRFATRGEDGASFVPGESFALEGFAAAGHVVRQSPLLFQGGNLLAVRDPRSGKHVLFVGEAEIHRNRSLGLSREEVLEALAAELGVDRTVVLPAISFHIDFELTVRAVGEELVAFVNDTPPAVRTVLECGLEGLRSQALLAPQAIETAREAIRAGRGDDFMAIVGPAVMSRMLGFGMFPEELAKGFARGASDSGVGNLQRFLLAIDLWMGVEGEPQGLAVDPHTRAYLASFRRREALRQELARTLEGEGLRVVRIPSLSDDERGLNYLNGIHAPGLYVMPAYGGLYAELDRAAQSAFEAALGPKIRVVPVASGETQRRGGGVHCAVSVHPRP